MNYFILGTDTGVGKTVLSLLFMKYFFMKGETPFYIKPFQTGCTDPLSPESDARFIYANIPELGTADPSRSVVHCFSQPKAPYFAAQSDGKSIDTGKAPSFIREMSGRHQTLIIEGAGGVYVPVTRDFLVVDLIREVKAHPVVAARAGLGTINHTLLTLEALKARGYEKPGIVFIDSCGEDPVMVRENMEAVEMISGLNVSGVIGRLADFSRPPMDAFDVVSSVVKGAVQADSTSEAASRASKGLSNP